MRGAKVGAESNATSGHVHLSVLPPSGAEEVWVDVVAPKKTSAKQLPCSPKALIGFSIVGLIIVAVVTTLAVVLTRTSTPTTTCTGTITAEGCNSTLSENAQYIADDCEVDVGTCSGEYCEGCTECCGPVFEERSETCSGVQVPFSKIVGCSCVSCDNFPLSVSGRVIGECLNNVSCEASIIVNGIEVTKSNADGYYTFPTTFPSSERLVFNVVDVQGLYDDKAHAFQVSRASQSYANVQVSVFYKSVPLRFLASNGTTINLGASEAVTLNVQPNSIVDENGDPYDGEVEMAVKFVDTGSDDDRQRITVELSSNGDPMISQGMLDLKLETASNGKTLTAMGVQIELSVDGLANNTNPEDISLFPLDETRGAWGDPINLQTAADTRIRRGRMARSTSTVLTASIDLSSIRRIWNLDALVGSYCYMKVRVFNNEEVSQNNQIRGTRITAIYRRANGEWTNYIDRWTWRSGACLNVPCSRSGWAEVDKVHVSVYGMLPYEPRGVSQDVKNGVSYSAGYQSFEITIPQSGEIPVSSTGPFYGKYDNRCYYNDVDEESYFRFVRRTSNTATTSASTAAHETTTSRSESELTTKPNADGTDAPTNVLGTVIDSVTSITDDLAVTNATAPSSGTTDNLYTDATSMLVTTEDPESLGQTTLATTKTVVNTASATNSVTTEEPESFSTSSNSIQKRDPFGQTTPAATNVDLSTAAATNNNSITTEELESLSASTSSIITTKKAESLDQTTLTAMNTDVSTATSTNSITTEERESLSQTTITATNKDVSTLTVTSSITTDGRESLSTSSFTTEEPESLGQTTLTATNIDVSTATATNIITTEGPESLRTSSNTRGEPESLRLSTLAATNKDATTDTATNSITTEEPESFGQNTLTATSTNVSTATATNSITTEGPESLRLSMLTATNIDVSTATTTNSITTEQPVSMGQTTHASTKIDVSTPTATNSIMTEEPESLGQTALADTKKDVVTVTATNSITTKEPVSMGQTTHAATNIDLSTPTATNSITTEEPVSMGQTTHAATKIDLSTPTATNSITTEEPESLGQTALADTKKDVVTVTATNSITTEEPVSMGQTTLAATKIDVSTASATNSITTGEPESLSHTTFATTNQDVSTSTATNSITTDEPVSMGQTILAAAKIDVSAPTATNSITSEVAESLGQTTLSDTNKDVVTVTVTNSITTELPEPSSQTMTVDTVTILTKPNMTSQATHSVHSVRNYTGPSPNDYNSSIDSTSPFTDTATNTKEWIHILHCNNMHLNESIYEYFDAQSPFDVMLYYLSDNEVVHNGASIPFLDFALEGDTSLYLAIYNFSGDTVHEIYNIGTWLIYMNQSYSNLSHILYLSNASFPQIPFTVSVHLAINGIVRVNESVYNGLAVGNFYGDNVYRDSDPDAYHGNLSLVRGVTAVGCYSYRLQIPNRTFNDTVPGNDQPPPYSTEKFLNATNNNFTSNYTIQNYEDITYEPTPMPFNDTYWFETFTPITKRNSTQNPFYDAETSNSHDIFSNTDELTNHLHCSDVHLDSSIFKYFDPDRPFDASLYQLRYDGIVYNDSVIPFPDFTLDGVGQFRLDIYSFSDNTTHHIYNSGFLLMYSVVNSLNMNDLFQASITQYPGTQLNVSIKLLIADSISINGSNFNYLTIGLLNNDTNLFSDFAPYPGSLNIIPGVTADRCFSCISSGILHSLNDDFPNLQANNIPLRFYPTSLPFNFSNIDYETNTFTADNINNEVDHLYCSNLYLNSSIYEYLDQGNQFNATLYYVMNDGILYYDTLIPFVDLAIGGDFNYNVGLYNYSDESSYLIFGNSSKVLSSRILYWNGSGDPFKGVQTKFPGRQESAFVSFSLNGKIAFNGDVYDYITVGDLYNNTMSFLPDFDIYSENITILPGVVADECFSFSTPYSFINIGSPSSHHDNTSADPLTYETDMP